MLDFPTCSSPTPTYAHFTEELSSPWLMFVNPVGSLADAIQSKRTCYGALCALVRGGSVPIN